MKYILFITLLFPAFTSAQTGSLQALLGGIGGFFNTVLIPFMLAIAFFIFVVNAIRFFIFQGDSEDGQKNAKALTLYSIAAFVFILSFWGIVNILNNGIGFETQPCLNDTTSDYIIRDTAPCTSPIPPPNPF